VVFPQLETELLVIAQVQT